MWRPFQLASLVASVGCALGTIASGQVVHIVTGAGGQFGDIQAAVDAAVDGDVLLVAEGFYSKFTIDGKSLSIFAMPGANVEIAHNSGPLSSAIVISNLQSLQQVVLSGLVTEEWDQFSSALVIAQNAGHVYLQDCRFPLEQDDLLLFVCEPWNGAPAAVVSASSRVAFTSCEFVGGAGDLKDNYLAGCDGGMGGAGLYCVDSRVAIYDCNLTGGNGGKSYTDGGTGGVGLDLHGTEIFVSGSRFEGGQGGIETFGLLGGGGDAVSLSATSVLHRLDCDLVGGLGSPSGGLVVGLGFDDVVSGLARSFGAPTLTNWSASFSGTYFGEAGDRVWVLASNGPNFRVFPFGVLLTAVPVPFPVSAGVAPSAGPFMVPIDISGLQPGVFGSQCFAASAAGSRNLGGPRHTMGLQPSSGPDCNGNGINDYLDLVAGTSRDTNNDLVPDECP